MIWGVNARVCRWLVFVFTVRHVLGVDDLSFGTTMRMMNGTLGIERMMRMKEVSRMKSVSCIYSCKAVFLTLTLRNGVVLKGLTHWRVWTRQHRCAITVSTPFETLLLHLPMKDCRWRLEKTSDTHFYSRHQHTSIRSFRRILSSN